MTGLPSYMDGLPKCCDILRGLFPVTQEPETLRNHAGKHDTQLWGYLLYSEKFPVCPMQALELAVLYLRSFNIRPIIPTLNLDQDHLNRALSVPSPLPS